MPVIYNHTQNFGFLHIPKMGGTAYEAWLRQVMPNEWTVYDSHEKQTSWHAVEMAQLQDCTWYATLRNPWSVTLSSYYHALRGTHKQLDFDQHLENIASRDSDIADYKWHSIIGPIDHGIQNATHVFRLEDQGSFEQHIYTNYQSWVTREFCILNSFGKDYELSRQDFDTISELWSDWRETYYSDWTWDTWNEYNQQQQDKLEYSLVEFE
jgi:hypothetical protein